MPIHDEPASPKEEEIESSPLKPYNVFHIWYPELCRRSGNAPLQCIRHCNLKSDVLLDLSADRVKLDDWNLILAALRQDLSLHVVGIHCRLHHGLKIFEEIDTEEKTRTMKKRVGPIWTRHVMKQLASAVGSCLRHSEVLSCLELDGVLMADDYLEPVLAALPSSRSLKMLSFRYCRIGDSGCRKLCLALNGISSVEIIDLSGCCLTKESGQMLAKVVKFQQISRYCESWHTSLRYEDPVLGTMSGLRRITLNNNPEMGDEGVAAILDVLEDDLWIKALDCQRVGVTQAMAGRIVDVVDYSRSLEVADFRHNNLDPSVEERIVLILRDKQTEESMRWCTSTTTLASTARALLSADSQRGGQRSLKQARSTPLRFKSAVTIRKPSCVSLDEAQAQRDRQTAESSAILKAARRPPTAPGADQPLKPREKLRPEGKAGPQRRTPPEKKDDEKTPPKMVLFEDILALQASDRATERSIASTGSNRAQDILVSMLSKEPELDREDEDEFDVSEYIDVEDPKLLLLESESDSAIQSQSSTESLMRYLVQLRKTNPLSIDLSYVSAESTSGSTTSCDAETTRTLIALSERVGARS